MASVEEQRVIDALHARLDAIEIKLGLKKEPPTPEEIAAAEAAAKEAADQAEYDRLTAKYGVVKPSDSGSKKS